jgi:hypothetical protein
VYLCERGTFIRTHSLTQSLYVGVGAGGLALLAGAAQIENLEAAVLVDIVPKMERGGGTISLSLSLSACMRVCMCAWMYVCPCQSTSLYARA